MRGGSERDILWCVESRHTRSRHRAHLPHQAGEGSRARRAEVGGAAWAWGRRVERDVCGGNTVVWSLDVKEVCGCEPVSLCGRVAVCVGHGAGQSREGVAWLCV